jgi:histidine triad (HIT) family protein
VYEDDEMIAFKDIHPQAPIHLLWISKKHIVGIDGTEPEHIQLMGRILFMMKEYAIREQLHTEGYRIVSNIGKNGRQSVRHMHFHFLAGRELSEILG